MVVRFLGLGVCQEDPVGRDQSRVFYHLDGDSTLFDRSVTSPFSYPK